MNVKGKKQALCWKCKLWFEAKTGLRVHSAKCTMPTPIREEAVVTAGVSTVDSTVDGRRSHGNRCLIGREEYSADKVALVAICANIFMFAFSLVLTHIILSLF